MNTENDTTVVKRGNAWALLPLGVFLLVYLCVSIITGDFYKMPVGVAFLIASGVAIGMDRGRGLSEKVGDFAKGMGNRDIMLMCLIFLLAGAFAQTGKAMGAIDSTVNMGLSLLPSNVLVAGLFLIACFISLAVGTSVGTIVAVAPIGVGVAEQLGLPLGLTLGSVIGGAMFGDNLSMISDTTIASARTQGVKMRDKFKMNIGIVLPGAVLTMLLYLFLAGGEATSLNEELEYSLIKVFPYVAVLVAALFGVNVILVLAGGVLISGVVGIYTESFDIWGWIAAVQKGISGMSELVIICLLVGGVVELIRKNGGIEFLISLILRNVKSKRGAELGIAALISVVDVCTANNTVAIIIAGPIAKDISDRFELDPRRTASLLDTFSCFAQGTIPYGAQILAAVSVAGAAVISPLEVMQYLYYPYLMGASALIVIMVGVRGKVSVEKVPA
ncbi:Na+/H+ antiporter NhaC family protein [Limibacter armeniacum]|uniref:Na+/H+ antiporter NhaC family protein n=1 Tax=Limibacter armeniacum TaxID=466084 RepID=UPI002FE5763B